MDVCARDRRAERSHPPKGESRRRPAVVTLPRLQSHSSCSRCGASGGGRRRRTADDVACLAAIDDPHRLRSAGRTRDKSIRVWLEPFPAGCGCARARSRHGRKGGCRMNPQNGSPEASKAGVGESSGATSCGCTRARSRYSRKGGCRHPQNGSPESFLLTLCAGAKLSGTCPPDCLLSGLPNAR